MSEQQDREAIIREIAKKKTVYTIPGMDALPVRRDLKYRGDLLMDIYCPSLQAGQRAPVVLIPFGYPDPQSGVRMFGPVTSWAQLIAASGMAAVIFGTQSPIQDAESAIAYLRDHAVELGLDAARLGIFSSSGNVPTALSLLMRDRGVTCAALLCGYTMDLDGGTGVADDARQFGFADACAGKSVDDLPDNVPMFLVRAGIERFPSLNDALDKVVARALARNLPVTFINHASGVHGFDCYEDNQTSRDIIRQVLAFLAFNLKA